MRLSQLQHRAIGRHNTALALPWHSCKSVVTPLLSLSISAEADSISTRG